jgi:Heterokaryon incompatibility protein (HET)
MAQIYQQATRVLIWLGEEDEYTDIAFTAIRKIALHPVLTDRPKGLGIDRQAAFKDIHHTFSSLARTFELVDFKLCDLSKEEITAIENTFRFRSWWTRIWVIQEIVVAKAATVICGSFTIAWDTLHISAVCESVVDILEVDAHTNTLDYEIQQAINALSVISNPGFLRADRLVGKRLKQLDEILSLTKHRHCTDSWDVVYGILSLITFPGQAIIPDYRNRLRSSVQRLREF